jgi:hypothetical protein
MTRSETDTVTVSRYAFRAALIGNTLDADDLFDTLLPGAITDATALTLEMVRNQARRYMEARHGPQVWHRAAETFPNVIEQWILAVALGEGAPAEILMTVIEQHAARPSGT